MTEIKQVTVYEARELLEEVVFDNLGRVTMDYCLLMSTDMWAGFINGKLACIWGIIPPTLMSYQAYLWLYTTDAIVGHEFILVRHSQLVIDGLLEHYPDIVGHATMGSDKSIRWLKWLGAKFGQPQGTNVPFRISRYG
jgi:hypothetical protein